MAAFIRKNLTFFIPNPTVSIKNFCFCISPVSFSRSRSLSTEIPTHPDIINPNLVYDFLVHKHDFPRAFASRVASELSRVKNPERVDSSLTFLKSSGFSNAQLQKILKYNPKTLCCSLEENIKPKIKGFQEEGFSAVDICHIISRNPCILELSLNNNIIPSLSVLRGLLGSNAAVVTVLKRSPRLVNSNLERTVVPNVEFLKSCGVSMDRIRIILIDHPSAFSHKPDVIRASAEKAKEMGLSVASKAFIYAIPTIASMSNEAWELKFQSFRDVGLSVTDISSMFRKEPRVFSVSTEKTKKIMEGLVATGRYDLSCIVDDPLSLMFSFEKRYEPRIRILRILESRNLIETWPTLNTFCRISDAEFFSRFVNPYSDYLQV